jgi:hypothetical protein
MKRKALIVALFCIMGLTLAGAAQATNYTCTISQVGILGGAYYVVYLTDTNTSTPGWAGAFPFLIPTTSQSIANGMYAAALTAYANSTNVIADIYNPGTMPQYSVIASLSATK